MSAQRTVNNRYLTLGTCGLNSTALWMASTADISAVLRPRLDAMSGENLKHTKVIWTYIYVTCDIDVSFCNLSNNKEFI